MYSLLVLGVQRISIKNTLSREYVLMFQMLMKLDDSFIKLKNIARVIPKNQNFVFWNLVSSKLVKSFNLIKIQVVLKPSIFRNWVVLNWIKHEDISCSPPDCKDEVFIDQAQAWTKSGNMHWWNSTPFVFWYLISFAASFWFKLRTAANDIYETIWINCTRIVSSMIHAWLLS